MPEWSPIFFCLVDEKEEITKRRRKKREFKRWKKGEQIPSKWLGHKPEREREQGCFSSLLYFFFFFFFSLSLTLLSFAGALNDLSSSSSDPAASRLVVNYFSSLPLNLLISSRNLFPLDSLILIAVLILLGFDFVMFLFSITITMID